MNAVVPVTNELVESRLLLEVTAYNINLEHSLARQSAENAVEHAVNCGRLLLAKKSELEHGEFMPWVEANCEFEYSTAARYVKAAKQISTGVEFSSIRHLFPSGRPREAAEPRQLLPLPEGQYRCIVIDPPWPVEKFEREVRPNQGGELDYATLTHEQIASLDVSSRAAPDGCHLFCWTTQKHLPAALDIVRHWGFTYCLTMVWHKSGGPQPFGLPQYNCEFVIYARLGAPAFVDTKRFFTCFNAPRREHSRKPDEFYDLIRRVTSPPRIDVFSRELRDGFEQYGDETGKFAA